MFSLCQDEDEEWAAWGPERFSHGRGGGGGGGGGGDDSVMGDIGGLKSRVMFDVGGAGGDRRLWGRGDGATRQAGEATPFQRWKEQRGIYSPGVAQAQAFRKQTV